MPELPEVEVLRRSLSLQLPGRTLLGVTVREPRLREPVDRSALERATSGQRVLRLERRGKYLLLRLSGGALLVVHLGMSGRLTVVPPTVAVERHEHVAFPLDDGRRLRLVDPRRFGLVFTCATSSWEQDRHFAHLGLEPLSEGFDGARLAMAARGRRGPVKPFLMDARIVVGVGNIYASESLYRAGIHPKRSVARVSSPRWQRLAESVRQVLKQSIAEGGTTLNDFVDGAGQPGYFQVSLAVYDRESQACLRCGGAIRRIVQAGRSTYYCSQCQR